MRAGGGADAGDRAPVAARGWELVGARLTGVPGLEMGCSLAWERSSGTCKARVIHLCGLCGSAEGMVVRAAEGAGLAAARPICVRVYARYQLDLGC